MSDNSPDVPISDADVTFIASAGRRASQDAVYLVLESVLWGIYAVFFVYAIRAFIKRGFHRGSRQYIAMMSVIIVLFSVSTILWVLNATWWWTGVNTLIWSTVVPLEDRLDMFIAKVTPLQVPMEGLFLFNMLIGDAVVVHRAMAIWGRWQIVVVPILFLIVSFAFAVTDLVCLAASGSAAGQSTVPIGSYACQHAEPIAWALSLITNIIATALISIKAWQHRNSMKDCPGQRHHRTPSEKVMRLLVESGIIYTVFWACEIILFFPVDRTKPIMYAWNVFAAIGDQVSGLYPTILLVITSLRRADPTMNTTGSISYINSGTCMQSIRFASGGKYDSTVLPDSFLQDSKGHSYSTTDMEMAGTATIPPDP